MSDYRYDTYQHYGTNAERIAFTPTPPGLAGSQPVYIWFETDTLTTWLYYTSWVQLGGSGSGGIGTVSITVTNAQMLALPTTPKLIVAAPGAGFYYDILSASIATDFTAGAYTNIDTGATIGDLPTLQLQTGTGAYLTSILYNDLNMVDPSTGSTIGALNALLGANASVVRFGPFAFSDTYPNGWGLLSYKDALVDHENQAINLGAYNLALGNYTGGNAANSAVVNVTYIKVAVP